MAQRFTNNSRSSGRLVIRYRDEPWRFATAFVAAVVTGLAAYPRGLGEETQAMGFLALLAVYFFIAYVGLLWIKASTVLLDRWFPWIGFPNSRLVFQLFCGWLIPVLLVYGLARSVLGLPQLGGLASTTTDFRETAAILVLSFSLSFNIAYMCAYFIALCRRLQRKAEQGLRLVRLSRQRVALHRAKPDEYEYEAAYRLATDSKPVLKSESITLPDSPSDGRYRHVTPFKTELLDYGEISEFILVANTVFVCREECEDETVKQRSLKEVEVLTGGYFRKVSRNRAIPHHRLKRCVARGAQLELTLTPNDEVIVVSEGYAAQIKGWVLSRISIER